MDPVQVYDVGETIELSCLFLTGATVGSIEQGQTTVYVRDPSGLDLEPGASILVEGGGYVGGDLPTTVVSSDGVGAVVVAEAARTSVSRGLVGTPADPETVTCTLALPDGTETGAGVSSPRTGLWTATFTPAGDGDHFYRFAGGGGDGWRKFVVRPERVPELVG
jgi:voltage-gated potassium channel Kch